ncbi:hypothetical protein LZQ00_05950 [Sphingobacterium sp. SRCM116780]|uniref:hypothetical protein n=1 Tax=Sphingobacterium sp. SRCM116780 TaxID=2907623 RepID=UPI001F31A33A|nr:hypothetical protein [Sphingobacterium sp. SRCM116780]UIR57358.1 hypothetical protein LZQ00_05950 [Sphingobacterium sp. SRCM116780]
MGNQNLDSDQIPAGYLEKVCLSAVEIARREGFIEGERHLREALSLFPQYIDEALDRLRKACL